MYKKYLNSSLDNADKYNYNNTTFITRNRLMQYYKDRNFQLDVIMAK